jgi:hypothetical protein
MLWHQRPEHIREKSLRVIHDKGMIASMENFFLDFYFYENFLNGKKNHVRFSSGAMREEGILQLVHDYFFGPVLIPSVGKYIYYVSFIDELLRNTWIYFLKNKYELFDKFKEFRALMENQIDKRIKVLRMNNGG